MQIIKSSLKSLEAKAAQLIAAKIRELSKNQDKIVLAIPGGNSIINILKNLKDQKLNWNKVHIFMVDELLAPANKAKSNYEQAHSILLQYLIKENKIPKENLHPYDYFNFSSQQGVEAYKNELREISHHFHIVLLSSGEDAHVGSLFPNHNSIKNQEESFIVVDNAPKLPKKRMSASRKLISKSKTALILFFGETKKEAYSRFLDKNLSIQDCPAKLVNDIEDSYVFTDLK